MTILVEFAPVLLKGTLITIALTVGGSLVALAMAFVTGLTRLSKRWYLRMIATVYLEIFRGTSALVQLFWIFFVLPFAGITLEPIAAGILAIGLNMGSYGSEVVRGAVLSIDKGQREAAIALNYSPYQRMRHVILPQAIPVMLPTFGNQGIELLKLTSVVSLITISDLTFSGQLVRSATGHTFEPLMAIMVIYFILATLIVQLVNLLEKRMSRGRSGLAARGAS
ncbi:ectoine/hydroxyectoine ABC transporter permease subunit EhuC [Roseibium sp. SCP14]|uniref:ectoine/hydroxyectoine ABC transporter permease subunit EhuC n=1 Tax=Roseibium sp. SCP14 TaxID=3141375 RepID=UPI00333C9773